MLPFAGRAFSSWSHIRRQRMQSRLRIVIATLLLCTGSGMAQQNGEVKKFNYPAAPNQQSSGRLPRHQGGRPLPSARRSRFRSNARLDRGRKQADLRLPEGDSRARKDSCTHESAVELRALLGPRKHGHRYFYSRNSGLQNQSVLYWLPALDAEPKYCWTPTRSPPTAPSP